MSPGEEYRDEWEAEGYRAIGRWWVHYARLIGGMRTTMEGRLNRPGDPAELIGLPFAEATAGQIANVFFAMCRAVGELDASELNIANQLQNEVEEANQLRNKMGHGDWVIGQPADVPGATVHAYLLRVYPQSRTPPWRRVETFTAKDLDEKSDRVRALIRLVYPFGLLALQQPVLTVNGLARGGLYRVSDVLVAENVPKNGKGGQVVRGGPKAAELL